MLDLSTLTCMPRSSDALRFLQARWTPTLGTLLAAALALTAPSSKSLAQAAPDSAGTADSSASPDSALARAVVREGFENVLVVKRPEETRVVFENRHFRHTSSALGTVARTTGTPMLAFEKRLSLVSAAIVDRGDGSAPDDILYPSDRSFPAPPRGSGQAPTRRTIDLLVDPLFTYELARILDPAQIRFELQPELRYNPWVGGRLRASVVIPVRNDFRDVDPDHPDAGDARPGPVLLDQFAWFRGAGLLSGTVGLLGENRYGLSMGFARPWRGGEILFDAQSDHTGFVAFGDSSVYSAPNRWTGFAGLTYRPANLDFAIRLRAARFLRGDRGVELEVRRTMGDVEVALFTQRIQGFAIGGVRVALPLPPRVRPVGWPVRVLPVERFPLTYREESTPVGLSVANVASREEYLRQLNHSALAAGAYRYRSARAGGPPSRQVRPPQRVSLVGTTGFVNTPWSGVMGDREIELGYNHYPKEASYQYRDKYPNEVYYAALGFLPRVEIGLRWSVVPGHHPFEDLVPESRYVDADRMFSARIEVLKPRSGRPGFGVGVEDARGTRRFHSTYGVLGLPFDIYHLQNRVTLGYAPHVFKASRRTLDGLFGAFEVSPWRSVAVAFEHDTEKWNTMLGVNLGFGLRARVALLDLEHVSLGAGFFQAF